YALALAAARHTPAGRRFLADDAAALAGGGPDADRERDLFAACKPALAALHLGAPWPELQVTLGPLRPFAGGAGASDRRTLAWLAARAEALHGDLRARVADTRQDAVSGPHRCDRSD